MTAQPSLFDQPTGRGTVQERYARWKRSHPQLYREIERRVLARANRADPRIEINDVFADVRKDWKPVNGKRWGLDNSFRSRIARDLITAHPFLAAKIETRTLKAE